MYILNGEPLTPISPQDQWQGEYEKYEARGLGGSRVQGQVVSFDQF